MAKKQPQAAPDQPLRLVLVARASKGKEDQANSIDAQIKRAEQFCQEKGFSLIVIDECLEQGISGKHVTTGKRVGPKHAIEMVKAGQADGVIASKLDRLGRSLVQIVEVADELYKAGGVLYFTNSGEAENTAMGRAFLQMMGIMAELERNLISERTKDALEVVKEKGSKSGKAIGRPRNEDEERNAKILESWDRLGNYNAVAKELDLHPEQIRRVVGRAKVS